MTNFETPIEFNIEKKKAGLEVVYRNLMEICQGGPEVGSISINGNVVFDSRFGGPWLSEGGYIYIPIFIKSFFGSGFKVAKINIESLSMEIISKKKELIFLDKVEDGKIYYYEDLEKTVVNTLDI